MGLEHWEEIHVKIIRIATMVALGTACSLIAPQGAVAAERILFNCFFPPQHYACREILPELKKRVENATNKNVRVTLPPKSLAAPPDQYDGVVNGVMDGAIQFNAFIANKVTGIQVGQLPFVGGQEARPASVALWRTYQKFFASKNEYGKALLVSVFTSNGAEFWSTTDQPIKTVEDIGKRKMWALPGVVANTIKPTGSAVVAGPAVQMLEIISKGIVDGFVGVPYSSIQAFKLADYTKSVTLFERKIFQPTFSFVINRDKWSKISEGDRKAIMAVLGEDFARFAGAVQDKYNENAKGFTKKAGIKELKGSAETLAKLEAFGKPIVDAWLKKTAAMGVDGKAAIAFYQQTYAEELAMIKK
jgi:TRAP-type C4-dicarboxylate transport system substrate-binding protein